MTKIEILNTPVKMKSTLSTYNNTTLPVNHIYIKYPRIRLPVYLIHQIVYEKNYSYLYILRGHKWIRDSA